MVRYAWLNHDTCWLVGSSCHANLASVDIDTLTIRLCKVKYEGVFGKEQVHTNYKHKRLSAFFIILA